MELIKRHIKRKIKKFKKKLKEVSGSGTRGKWRTLINEFELLLEIC
jgi:hypothetical protein